MSRRIAAYVRRNLTALIALFVALGGTAYASNEWTGDNIVNGSLTTNDYKNNDIKGVDVENGTLGGNDLAAGAITSDENCVFPGICFDSTRIADRAVGASEISPGAVDSSELALGSVTPAKLAPDAVGSPAVAPDSLTGADVDESTLGRVPDALSASVGGIGRSTSLSGCNPSDETLITCATVSMTLPAPSRVLLIGRVRAIVDDAQTQGYGSCDLGTNFSGPITGSSVEIFTNQNTLTQVPLMIVTPVIGAGSVMFGIDCNQEPIAGGIRYDFISLEAVALSND
jgi:hypothetical protein